MSIQQITNHYDNSTYITSNDEKSKSDVIQKDSNEAVVYEKAKDTKDLSKRSSKYR